MSVNQTLSPATQCLFNGPMNEVAKVAQKELCRGSMLMLLLGT